MSSPDLPPLVRAELSGRAWWVISLILTQSMCAKEEERTT
jgi:hypothetical protein